MKTRRLIFAVAASAIISIQSMLAVTGDELAAFLNISSWRTVVDLPAESYSIEICEINDGAIGDRVLASEPQWTRKPEAGISIMASPQNGKYKLGIIFSSGGSLRAETNVPTLDQTLGANLPEKIREGDYVLLGKPVTGSASLNSNDIKTFSKGFLLRIKKA